MLTFCSILFDLSLLFPFALVSAHCMFKTVNTASFRQYNGQFDRTGIAAMWYRENLFSAMVATIIWTKGCIPLLFIAAIWWCYIN
jgi:hypothetical protein